MRSLEFLKNLRIKMPEKIDPSLKDYYISICGKDDRSDSDLYLLAEQNYYETGEYENE